MLAATLEVTVINGDKQGRWSGTLGNYLARGGLHGWVEQHFFNNNNKNKNNVPIQRFTTHLCLNVSKTNQFTASLK